MKILRKILKIITLIIASILILLVLLVGLAKLFESELVSFTLGRLEKRIDAPLSIGKVSLIPLFSFPRVSAEINDLLIGNPNGYNDDTLFCIGSLKVGLDSWNFFHGIYTIDKIEISDVSFDYEVLENGESNIDFLIQAFSDTTTVINTKPEQASDLLATPLDITAEKIKLENIQINYMDSINTIGAQLNIPDILKERQRIISIKEN